MEDIEEKTPAEEALEERDTVEAEKSMTMTIAPLTVPRAIIWNGFMIAAAVIIAAFIVVHGLGQGTPAYPSVADANAAAAQGAQAPAAAPDASKVVTTSEPYIGNPNAPVTLDYWSDYQCPYCKQFETKMLPTIVQNYVDTGKVKVVFKDFSFLGDDSDTDALYARAVWNLYPTEFFAWRTAMFNAQDGENTGFGDKASVEKLTATIDGIDASKVTADVATNKDAYTQAIAADRDEAQQYGVEGTPSFITGTQLIKGVVPYSTFQTDFDAQLK